MSKIMPEHLARSAFVDVRQSTAYQVANNLESQRRQYGLVERARQLGWADVQVVDDDLANPAVGQRGRDLRSCWQPSVKAEFGQLCPWRLPAWHATAVTGTRCWSSAALSAH